MAPGRSELPPLKVTILGATNLRKADVGLFYSSDPYVVVEVTGEELLGAGKKEKLRTPVLSNTLNPKWNHTVTISEYMPGDALKFTVMDEDKHSRDDSLGYALLSHKQWGHAGGFHGEVELVDGKPDSWIQIKVHPLPKPPPRQEQGGNGCAGDDDDDDDAQDRVETVAPATSLCCAA